MSDEKYTRCPGCQTVFRVTSSQLAIRGGQVRCGHCRNVFDGADQLISLAPPLSADGEDEFFDETALGPPTVTRRRAEAVDLPPASADAERADALPEPTEPVAEQDRFGEEIPQGEPAAGEDRSDRGPPTGRRRSIDIAYAVAVPAVVLLLIGQAVFHFRDAIAARWPAARPVLAKVCEAAGCAVRPPRDIADLLILGSDLQADPAHKGLLILTATVRNRAATALAYPYLELTLTDAQDQVVVRRALAPSEYAGGTADLTAGIPANGEVAIKVFIDASATAQAGYRVYLFYS